MRSEAPVSERFRLVTSHASALAAIGRDPTITAQGIADLLGVTESRVIQIIRELKEAGLISNRRTRSGRQYTIHTNQPISDEFISHMTVDQFLSALSLPSDSME